MAFETENEPGDNAFDGDTHVTRIRDGEYAVEVTDRWNIGDVANGGYTMAIAGRALSRALPFSAPLSLTGFYFEAIRPAQYTVSVEIVKTGGATATGVARFHKDGNEAARYVGTFGRLGEPGGVTRLSAGPPELPDLDACVPFGYIEGVTPQIVKQVDVRMPPEAVSWLTGKLGERAELGGWIRFADGREPDPLSLLLFADAFPPPVFTVLGMQRWVPTLNLSVQIRNRPSPGWLRCWFRTRFVTGGYLEEDGEIWDSDDKLVALSRQLAVLWR